MVASFFKHVFAALLLFYLLFPDEKSVAFLVCTRFTRILRSFVWSNKGQSNNDDKAATTTAHHHQIEQSRPMPRTRQTGRGGRTAPDATPLERYQNLDWHDQYICQQYYLYIATAGSEGWNINQTGSIYHKRSSNYIDSLGGPSWFRHRARVMVSLAQAFAERNEAPPPLPPRVNPQQEPHTPPPPQRGPSMMPSTPALRTPPRTPARTNAIDNLNEQLQGINLGDPANGDVPGLSVPMCFGIFNEFNFTTRRDIDRVLMRMIFHNAVEERDIQFRWISPRKCMIRVAWPDWFRFAEQMAAFTTDSDGNIMFPPRHPITMDTARRNERLVDEESNRVWDEGYLTFEQDMKTDAGVTFELLTVPIPSKNTSVNVLQIFAE